MKSISHPEHRRHGAPESRDSVSPHLSGTCFGFLLVLVTSLLQAQQSGYEVEYVVEIEPGRSWAEVSMNVTQASDLLRAVRFRVDSGHHVGFEGDGHIERTDEFLHWTPPANGGQLRWRAELESQRSNGAYDGLITDDWAIFRGDDLVPPARTRSLRGATSHARLQFDLPSKWSASTPFEKDENGAFLVDNPDRNFDRPTGWFALGDLGVRWETIADIRLAIAGPRDQGLRRQDILAFLNWTLPTVSDIFPSTPDRLLIVGAGDPMWRGGLSGPASLYIHADRPLISENGTSTLLHELIHVATSISADDGADWIVEGLAEYYALQVLLRSGTITPDRYQKSMERLKKWGGEADDLTADRSSGAVTARAVTLLATVDKEIRKGSDGNKSLDGLVRKLASGGTVSNRQFVELAEEMAGQPISALNPVRNRNH